MSTDSDLYSDGSFHARKCPVCKKLFIPAPMHAYHKNEDADEPLVCSWRCARAEKAYEKARAVFERKQLHPPVKRLYVYTIYDRKHGRTLVTDKTAREAAELLGKSLAAFYAMSTLANKDKNNRWTVIKRLQERREV